MIDLYSFYTVDNRQEALDILAKRRYTLILVDRLMPVMDGITATKAIIAKPIEVDNIIRVLKKFA